MILFLLSLSIGLVADLLWKLLEYPWQRLDENDAPTADAIIVLSSGGRPLAPGKAKIFEWGDPDRFFAGISLFQKNKAPRIFFTGGTNPYVKDSKNEGTLYQEYAITLGIPIDAITTTGNVVNTLQEAIETRKSFNPINSSSKILLVTSAFHMKRAKKIFERQGFKVEPFPVDFKTSRTSSWQNPYQWIPNSQSLSKSSLALREIIGRTFYRSW